jgi:hypothetical protein
MACGIGQGIRKPKGMHRKTFAREMTKVEDAGLGAILWNE